MKALMKKSTHSKHRQGIIMDQMNRTIPNRYLILIDLLSITIAFILASWIRFGSISGYLFGNNIYGFAYAIILAVYLFVYYMYNTYSKFFKRGFYEEFLVVMKLNVFLSAMLTGIMFLFQEGARYSRYFFLCFILLNTLITYMARQYYKVCLLSFYRKSKASSKLMVLTTSGLAPGVLGRIRKENEWNCQVTYITILDKDMTGLRINGVEVKASRENMFAVARREAVDCVLIHLPQNYSHEVSLEKIIMEFESMGAEVNLSINTFGLKLHEKVVRDMNGYHVLTFSTRLFNEDQLQLKRLLDIIGGFIGCIFTIVLTIFIAPAIYIESPGPIFFSQTRIGRNGRRFKIYKFRSMYPDAEQRLAELMDKNEMNGLMFKMTDDPRITKVGKFLRKTSLDEFPQFFNILRGDMSLVGTRPPTEKEFLQYEGWHKRRLALKSGLTGLWQVSGRSDISEFEEVVKLDLEYIDNWSLMLDIKIILKTVWVVLFGKGAK